MLVLAIVVLVVVHAAIGLPPPVLYGVGGGLLVSLLIAGLDWLRGSRRPSLHNRPDTTGADDHIAR